METQCPKPKLSHHRPPPEDVDPKVASKWRELRPPLLEFLEIKAVVR